MGSPPLVMETSMPRLISHLRSTAAFGALAVAAILSAPAALAGPVYQVGSDYEIRDGNGGGAYNPLNLNRSVTLSLDFDMDTVRNNSNTSAGLFMLESRLFGSGASWDPLETFCLQLDVSLNPFDNPYRAISLTSAFDASTADKMRELWGRFFNTIKTAPTVGARQDRAAAFQILLWELAHDGPAFDLAGGKVAMFASGGVNSTQNRVRNQILSWYGALDGSGPKANLGVLRDNSAPDGRNTPDRDRQDLLVEVPTPGTLALLGSGLIGLAMVRRRKTA